MTSGTTDLSDRAGQRLVWGVVGLAVLPIVVAVVRAIVDGWMPVGDDAYFTIRSRDVLTRHHPLLGAWSSGSSAIDSNVNNLGPLQLDLLAPFTKLHPGAGTAIGVGLVHIASILTIAGTVRRLAGPMMLFVAMAVTSTVAWSLGSEMLITPRQHQFLVLPFLCFLVLAWAAACGALWALPGMIFAGSLVIQTHLSYAVLVTVIAVSSVVAAAWTVHHARAPLAPSLRWFGVGAAVALVCWAQPLWEQVAGDGNIGRVLGASGSGAALGVGDSARLAATVVAVPPWILRPSYAEFDPQRSASPAAALLGLAVVAVAIGGAAWIASRRGDRTGIVGVATAGVALVVAILSGSTVPIGSYGVLAGNYRWLWSIGGFTVIVVIAALADRRRVTRPLGVVLIAVTAVVSLANLPESWQVPSGDVIERQAPVVRRLVDQLDGQSIDGPVVYDDRAGYFGHPFAFPVLLRLQDLGIEFRFDDADNVYRFGDGRAADGSETGRLVFAWGDDARRIRPDAERVAFVDGLDGELRAELVALTGAVVSDLRAGRIVVTAASDEPEVDMAAVEAAVDGDAGGPPVLVAGQLTSLLRAGRLGYGGGDTAARLTRLADLSARHTFDTVALFLVR